MSPQKSTFASMESDGGGTSSAEQEVLWSREETEHKPTDAPHEEERAGRTTEGLAVNSVVFLYEKIWVVSNRHSDKPLQWGIPRKIRKKLNNKHG